MDLFLFDVKLVDDARHRALTGLPPAPILENLRALAAVHRGLWIRVPVVPGHTDDEADLAATAALVAGLPGVRRVSLLPYHRTGAPKARAPRAARTRSTRSPRRRAERSRRSPRSSAIAASTCAIGG